MVATSPLSLNPPDLFPANAGVLPSQILQQLVAQKSIDADEPIEEGQIQPSSIDLRLGNHGYQVSASFLPGRNKALLSRLETVSEGVIDLQRPQILYRGKAYVFPLMERLNLAGTNVWGRANPKSTTGRLDVFTRLITDYATQFDYVEKDYCGDLYVEVAPRSFDILVHAGTKLNQLRLIRGDSLLSDRNLAASHKQEPVAFRGDGTSLPNPKFEGGLWLSVDTKGTIAGNTVGYVARYQEKAIDLDRINYYDPWDYWDEVVPNAEGMIRLRPDAFYILASKERVRVPAELAAEMVSFDPLMGEFRVHYAGFFDPGFGFGQGDLTGTVAVLEVRSHHVPFLLEDGQYVARLKYERLMQEPSILYGVAAGSSYESQQLRLSKQFRIASTVRQAAFDALLEQWPPTTA